ncbi:hypothetical protein PHLCEN_2v8231 [Hermanssonia centrifuga]|uniref:Uncharacterized protein n=1 Tax=Hermanssonia centrifuga TaxID=98765 RepID=A0A2R6NU85_9APHY|nr:hypothetical protein PHLCEN_2v8231 [Hermanssonia centrifuga]
MSKFSNTEIREKNINDPITDETNKFKKPYQTVGRPPVTANIHDEYMRNPPNNHPVSPATDRRHPSVKEGAYEWETPRVEQDQGYAGVEQTGKYTKDLALAESVQENSVHGNVDDV